MDKISALQLLLHMHDLAVRKGVYKNADEVNKVSLALQVVHNEVYKRTDIDRELSTIKEHNSNG